jgi:starch synthase
VLTIHNIGYQGNLPRWSIEGWDIEQIASHGEIGPLFSDPHADWNSVNPLRLALELAHQTNTVSPTYKKEMTQPEDQGRYFEGGKGLEEVTARLDAKGILHGILNGFEYRFVPDDGRFEQVLVAKAQMKRELSKDFPDPDGLLLGFVGRAVEQKFKLLTEQLGGKSVLEQILDLPGVNVAIVASGQPKYEDLLRQLASRPNLALTLAFDQQRARQVSLGSDVFLMPSLFEPCGITQMESLSYATPPLVRRTGGLADTVRPHTAGDGTGFVFDGARAEELLDNLVKAVVAAQEVFTSNQRAFRGLQERGFRERFLWSTAARHYVDMLYAPALKG